MITDVQTQLYTFIELLHLHVLLILIQKESQLFFLERKIISIFIDFESIQGHLLQKLYRNHIWCT